MPSLLSTQSQSKILFIITSNANTKYYQPTKSLINIAYQNSCLQNQKISHPQYTTSIIVKSFSCYHSKYFAYLFYTRKNLINNLLYFQTTHTTKNMQKPINPYTKGKQKMSSSQTQKPKKHFTTISAEISIDVRESIERILLKMENSKIQTLQPPFFQKTLTKFRQQSYSLKLRPQIIEKLSSTSDQKLLSGLKALSEFITNFDDQYIDAYCQQIRDPYTRKIFNEGYEIDKVNFKRLNSEYELRKQIGEVLSQTSEWLILLERLEDLLTRIELYFGIESQRIMEKLKAEGVDNRKGTWSDYVSSLIKKVASYTLRKGSKVVQNTGYASMLSPGFAILTWAIIGGNSTIPWKSGIDIKSLLIPVVAFTVPYLLDSMAENIEKSDFKTMLEGWAEQFEIINDSLRKFGEMIENQITYCSKSQTRQQYIIHFTNLSKYVHKLSSRIEEIQNYNEETFSQMRERTQAYYATYIQLQQGEWTTVMTEEQFENFNKIQQGRKIEEKWETKRENQTKDQF